MLIPFKQDSIGIVIFWDVCHVPFLFFCKWSHSYPSLVNTKTTELHIFKLLFFKFKEEFFFMRKKPKWSVESFIFYKTMDFHTYMYILYLFQKQTISTILD